MLSDEWLSRYGLLENFNASVTRTGTRTGTGTWTTGVTAIALCTSCSRAKNQKACSINDHVLNEYLKYSKDSMLPIYCKLFNLILNTGIVLKVLFCPFTKIKGT